MKRLSKAQLAEQVRIVEHLNTALTDFREAVTAAYEWVQDLHESAESYAYERSDAWRDSAGGSAYVDWIESMREAHSKLEEVIDLPELGDLIEAIAESPDAVYA